MLLCEVSGEIPPVPPITSESVLEVLRVELVRVQVRVAPEPLEAARPQDEGVVVHPELRVTVKLPVGTPPLESMASLTTQFGPPPTIETGVEAGYPVPPETLIWR
jgi:hypothetical protein